MIKSRAEGRPLTIGRGPSGRCDAQIVQAPISATSRLKAGSVISPLEYCGAASFLENREKN